MRLHRSSLSLPALALLVVAIFAACTPGPSSPESNTAARFVDPQLTDPALPSEPEAPNFSILPQGDEPERGSVVVLFNATGSAPSSLTRVARVLAADGHHVIGLRYESDAATLDACPHPSTYGLDCHRQFRGEIAVGTGVSAKPGGPTYDHPTISVTPTRSVMNRLLAYVDYLALTRPGEGWDQFQRRDGDGDCAVTHTVYDRCELRWDRVVTFGYSQGSGIALFLSTFRELRRVAMLSGPFDAFGSGGSYTPAPWLSDPFATDKADIAVYLHDQESHAGRIRTAVNTAGITDAEVNTKHVARPYQHSRRLVTTVQPTCPSPAPAWAHTITVGGGCSPSGAHDDAWRYLASGE